MNKTQVLQTDEAYKPKHFQKQFVEQLFTFFKTMKNWKIAKTKTGEPFNYFAFLTFKIQNGKVINIIP